ncbi:peptidylprolyl isomerase [Vibrio ulleungensis]|uniref:Peptidyl-prolyl cis-trans isomerase n=1 Tax=Vibrio ulleungensis TaxID=2807619 RepID=A0ABS2HHD6_9VIBR|nr:peptidylprolyl isomerase [Vibrio ulleungensis]MBM7036444.1 peptidylprolyl isomerase [Vibrio ulleungensis]
MKPILPLITLLCASAWVNAAPLVEVETTLGNFVIDLDSELAPISSENFLSYVEDGSYEGTIFHRVIKDFMAQGGGFDDSMNQLPTQAPIKNEASNGLKNLTATVAMARTNNPDSATRQFFINYKDNYFLDHTFTNPGYAVFGKVVDGFDVIQKMATVPTGSYGPFSDVPTEQIVIKKMTVLAE